MIWAMQRLTFLLYHSEGLKRAEIENKQLRENFIETRDKLELAQQNHRKALNDLHDQTLSTARREEDMKEKMKAMNKEFYKEIQGLEEASRSQVSSCNISIL
jgi:flagellar biosynthesis/type III secretory pathway protein FliH